MQDAPRRGSLKERVTAYEAAASPRAEAPPPPRTSSASASPLQLEPSRPESAESDQPAPLNERLSSVLSLGAFPDDPPTPEPAAAPPNMGRSPRTSITLGQCVSSGGELGVTPGAEAIGPVISAALMRANALLAERCSVPRIATVLAQSGIYDSDTLRMVLACSAEEQRLGVLLASKADAPLALLPVLRSQLLGAASPVAPRPEPSASVRRSSVRASGIRSSSIRASSIRASGFRASSIRASGIRSSSMRGSRIRSSSVSRHGSAAKREGGDDAEEEAAAAEEAEEEEEAPAETSVAVEVIALALRCQCGEVMPLLRASMGAQIDAIATFFEDATVFVLSRLWSGTLVGDEARLATRPTGVPGGLIGRGRPKPAAALGLNLRRCGCRLEADLWPK